MEMGLGKGDLRFQNNIFLMEESFIYEKRPNTCKLYQQESGLYLQEYNANRLKLKNRV